MISSRNISNATLRREREDPGYWRRCEGSEEGQKQDVVSNPTYALLDGEDQRVYCLACGAPVRLYPQGTFQGHNPDKHTESWRHVKYEAEWRARGTNLREKEVFKGVPNGYGEWFMPVDMDESLDECCVAEAGVSESPIPVKPFDADDRAAVLLLTGLQLGQRVGTSTMDMFERTYQALSSR